VAASCAPTLPWQAEHYLRNQLEDMFRSGTEAGVRPMSFFLACPSGPELYLGDDLQILPCAISTNTAGVLAFSSISPGGFMKRGRLLLLGFLLVMKC
jgi:hypothetical protein